LQYQPEFKLDAVKLRGCFLTGIAEYAKTREPLNWVKSQLFED